MSTTPTRPVTEPEISDRERRIIEQRLATADDEPRQDARQAIEEIRRELHHASPR
jgi:hypothetical protein